MSHAFFDDAENRLVLRICSISPGFIPIVLGGLLHPVRETSAASYPVSANLSAKDYVLGLEVLGCKLVRNEVDIVVVREFASFVRDTRRTRARQIQAVMTDDWEGRRTDLSDYCDVTFVLHPAGAGVLSLGMASSSKAFNHA